MNYHDFRILKFSYQKKDKVFHFPIDKPITEYFRVKIPKGNILFRFLDKEFKVSFDDFFDLEATPISFISIDIFIPEIHRFKAFFHQGYNNWTQTYETSIKNKHRNLSFFIRWLFTPLGEYTIIKYLKDFDKNLLRSFFYTYLRDYEDKILLFFSLNEKESFTIFQLDYKNSVLRIIKDFQNFPFTKSFRILSMFIGYGDYYTLFKEVLPKLDRKEEEPVTGYTTWYYHYTNIDYPTIIRRLEFFGKHKIPLDYFQVDDGYQKYVGDWLSLKQSFQGKMPEFTSKALSYGIKPGIWIAPFICEKKSNLFYYHEEWLLRDERGKPVIAGFNPLWSWDFYALNIYNKDFQDYLRDVLHTMMQWGFHLFKLDFLYASSIYPAKRKSRAIQMQDAIRLIHKIIGENNTRIKLLACGVPFSHVFGNFHYSRVGSDVEEKWDNYMKNFHFLERVSTKNSLTSTIFRHVFNGKNFLNDPDVFFLRDQFRSFKKGDRSKNISLSEEEKLTLLFANFVFGNLVFTSDPVEEYDEEKFKLYLKTFPILRKEYMNFTIHAESFFEIHFSVLKKEFFSEQNKKEYQLEYVFYVNLSDNYVETLLSKEELYFVAFPFQKRYGIFLKNVRITIPPRGSLLLLKTNPRKLEILGSDGHIFPLGEIASYSKRKKKIELERKSFGKSNVYLLITKEQKESRNTSIQEAYGYYYQVIEITKHDT